MLDCGCAVHLSAHLLALAVAAPPLPQSLDAGLGGVAAGPARAVWASERLLGAPYRTSALGEGRPPDADPRFRLDAFDCVTLVETAVALGNAGTVAEAARLLDDVRYLGPPDFAHRSHYLMAQWIPRNLEKGWIAEATRAVAGPLAETARKRYTRASWRAAEAAGRALADLPAEMRPMGAFEVPLVPLARVMEVAPRIPSGTVLLVLREDRPSRPYRVTHMGIVVVGKAGTRFLRHAGDVPAVMRVRDERLDRFLARNARYHGWPVSGVAFYAIRDNAARARALLDGPRAAR